MFKCTLCVTYVKHSVHTEGAFLGEVHTRSGLAAECHQNTGGFQGTPSHSDSDRMTESADSQWNQPGSDLTAAGW